MTDEQRVRMSLAHMGHVVSDETRTKMSTASKNMSPETRARMSASKMGNTNCLGHHPSLETRAKISAAGMGRIQSPEMRAKLWKGGRQVFRRKSNAKRRLLGFILMNSPFLGYEGHHLDKDRVVYIPKPLHKSVWHNVLSGKNMEKINTLAVQWWMSQVMRTGHTLPVGG
jgi:hypothetical protein